MKILKTILSHLILNNFRNRSFLKIYILFNLYFIQFFPSNETESLITNTELQFVGPREPYIQEFPDSRRPAISHERTYQTSALSSLTISNRRGRRLLSGKYGGRSHHVPDEYLVLRERVIKRPETPFQRFLRRLCC